jgi:hypothetical protein
MERKKKKQRWKRNEWKWKKIKMMKKTEKEELKEKKEVHVGHYSPAYSDASFLLTFFPSFYLPN